MSENRLDTVNLSYYEGLTTQVASAYFELPTTINQVNMANHPNEIIYFGNYKMRTKIAKKYIELTHNASLTKNCEVPALRIFGPEDAQKATKQNVKFPIECGIASDSVDYIDFVPVKNAKELVELAKLAQSNEGGECDLVARKGAMSIGGGGVEVFVVLGSDFSAFNRASDQIIFGANNEDLFSNNNLDKNYVYRFGYNGHSLFLDNMVHRSSIELNATPFENFDSKKIENIRTTFSCGLFNQIKYGASQLHSSGYDFSATADNEQSVAYAMGGVLGSQIKDILDTAFAGVGYKHPSSSSGVESIWRSVIVKLAAAYSVSDDSIKNKIDTIAEIHSAIMGHEEVEDPSKFLIEKMAALMTKSDVAMTLKNYALLLSEVSKFLSLNESIDGNGLDRKLVFPEIPNFTSKTSITLSKFQVRILENYKNNLSLRVQVYDMNFSGCTMTDEETLGETEVHIGNKEFQIALSSEDVQPHFKDIKEWREFFESLNHSEKSQAGTGAKYVPLDLTEEGFAEKGAGKIVIPMHKIVTFCKEHYATKTESAISIANGILEKLIK